MDLADPEIVLAGTTRQGAGCKRLPGILVSLWP